MKLSSKLYLVTGTLITLAVILSVIGVVGIRKTNAGLETVYNDRVVPLKQLKAIADDLPESLRADWLGRPDVAALLEG